MERSTTLPRRSRSFKHNMTCNGEVPADRQETTLPKNANLARLMRDALVNGSRERQWSPSAQSGSPTLRKGPTLESLQNSGRFDTSSQQNGRFFARVQPEVSMEYPMAHSKPDDLSQKECISQKGDKYYHNCQPFNGDSKSTISKGLLVRLNGMKATKQESNRQMEQPMQKKELDLKIPTQQPTVWGLKSEPHKDKGLLIRFSDACFINPSQNDHHMQEEKFQHSLDSARTSLAEHWHNGKPPNGLVTFRGTTVKPPVSATRKQQPTAQFVKTTPKYGDGFLTLPRNGKKRWAKINGEMLPAESYNNGTNGMRTERVAQNSQRPQRL